MQIRQIRTLLMTGKFRFRVRQTGCNGGTCVLIFQVEGIVADTIFCSN